MIIIKKKNHYFELLFYYFRAVAYKQQPMFGRHGAHKHHDTMGEVSVDSTTYLYYLKKLYNSVVIIYR